MLGKRDKTLYALNQNSAKTNNNKERKQKEKGQNGGDRLAKPETCRGCPRSPKSRESVGDEPGPTYGRIQLGAYAHVKKVVNNHSKEPAFVAVEFKKHSDKRKPRDLLPFEFTEGRAAVPPTIRTKSLR